jgi:glycosyltransferase involved in cell wall biosynthesis
VVSFTEKGELAEKIRQLGIEVIELKRGSFFAVFRQLIKLVNQYQPNVMQSWLYRADLVSGLVGRIKGIPVVWNIRQTQVAKVRGQNHIWLIQRLNALLSHILPRQIIYCAQAAKSSHEAIGFSRTKNLVINNGIDTNKFKSDESLRTRQRHQWEIDGDECLIGMVGRFDPLKNHARFLRIVSKAVQLCPELNIRAVLIGRGINKDNKELNSLIQKCQLNEQIILVDETDEIISALNAMDVHVLTSDNEGWPNVLGEALSVGLPCVTTNVGDVKMMMSDQDSVIAVNDENRFVDKLIEKMILQKEQRQQLAEQNRRFIHEHCSLESTVKEYDDLYSTYLSD